MNIDYAFSTIAAFIEGGDETEGDPTQRQAFDLLSNLKREFRIQNQELAGVYRLLSIYDKVILELKDEVSDTDKLSRQIALLQASKVAREMAELGDIQDPPDPYYMALLIADKLDEMANAKPS